MALKKTPSSRLNPSSFLSTIVAQGTSIACKVDDKVFSQGDPSDAVFYVQAGKVKLTVISPRGKEAILALVGANHFLGEQCLAYEMFRVMTVTAVEDCSLVRVERDKMRAILRISPQLSEFFISAILSENIHLVDELVDHFFNHSEKRLARLLLSLSHFGRDPKTEAFLPKISQETLAEMVGTTRGRISFFMTKFKKQGYIDTDTDCTGRLRIHNSLLDKVLRD